ncbi:MAG: hypothetical protein RML94_05820 [Bacteroidia bacterium]|nr:hypothetical protein [Bacteroidia bacterium]
MASSSKLWQLDKRKRSVTTQKVKNIILFELCREYIEHSVVRCDVATRVMYQAE